jgi:hypothetical protein
VKHIKRRIEQSHGHACNGQLLFMESCEDEDDYLGDKVGVAKVALW